MFFNRADNERRNYPRIWNMIAVGFPALEAHHPNLWQAFKRYCVDESAARNALRFGEKPFLVVDSDLWGATNVTSGNNNPAVGQYRGRSPGQWPNRIFLAKAVAREYEKAGSAQLRKIVQAAILHETVHYVRHTTGNDFWDGVRGDPGTAFEETAYGSQISLLGKRVPQFPEPRH